MSRSGRHRVLHAAVGVITGKDQVKEAGLGLCPYLVRLKLTDAGSGIGCRAKLARGLQRGCVGPHGLIAAVNG